MNDVGVVKAGDDAELKEDVAHQLLRVARMLDRPRAQHPHAFLRDALDGDRFTIVGCLENCSEGSAANLCAKDDIRQPATRSRFPGIDYLEDGLQGLDFRGAEAGSFGPRERLGLVRGIAIYCRVRW